MNASFFNYGDQKMNASLNCKWLPKSLTLAMFALYGSFCQGDTSIGIDPYAANGGFDRPPEAAWGGWQRCSNGTLYAEWDKFVDASFGTSDDYTAAPNSSSESVASCGTSSAWLAWATNAPNPMFAYSNGNYVYNLSNGGQGGKTAYRIEATGGLTQGHTRVVLQIETRSYAIPEETLNLNGIKPTASAIKLEQDTTISGRAAKVYHQLVVWNLAQAPEAIRIGFEAKEHTVLQLIALDAGPLGTVSSSNPTEEKTGRLLVNLSAESIDPEVSRLLNLQAPKFFPSTWTGSDLLFKQNVPSDGRTTRSLRGGFKALFYPLNNTENLSNRIILDIYRKDPIADVKYAECELIPTKKRRWAKVNLNNQIQSIGTAVYSLDVASKESGAGLEKLTKKGGTCDVDLTQSGLQAGVPTLRDGDYIRVRRVANGG